MKTRVLFLLLPLWLLVVPGSQASNVNVGVNVNIGAPAPAVVIAAPAPAVVIGAPELVIASPPEFLLIPALGLHVSIDAPYDLFYLDGQYYQFHKNRWYRSNHYQGPWGYVERGRLPKRLLKHEYPEMIDWRDREYREYNKDRGKHRDRYFRAEDRHERREARRDDHREKNKGNHGHRD